MVTNGINFYYFLLINVKCFCHLNCYNNIAFEHAAVVVECMMYVYMYTYVCNSLQWNLTRLLPKSSLSPFFHKNPYVLATHGHRQVHIVAYLVTRHGFWIGNWVYWTLMTRTIQIIVCSTCEVFYFFTSCSLVVAFSGGPSPSSGFLSCPRPQLPTFHNCNSQLTQFS
jgi:hypothetical protein